jgi:hypothetical protein
VDARVIACINTITLAEAMSLEQLIERCLPPLKRAASRIAGMVEREWSGEGEKPSSPRRKSGGNLQEGAR